MIPLRLKLAAEQATPPILFNALRRLAGKRPQAPPLAVVPMFQAGFASFDEAAAACDGYESEAIGRAIAMRAATYQNGLPVEMHELFLEVHSALSFIVSEPSQSLRVLDIGGGIGSYFLVMRRLMPRTRLDWTILETGAVAAASRRVSTFGDIWVTDMPASNFDVALISGSLQYMRGPYDMLKRAASASRWIILTRVPVSDREEDQVFIQHPPRDLLPGSLPLWIFSKRLILDAIGDVGRIVYAWNVETDTPALQSVDAVSRGFLIETQDNSM